MSDAFEEFGPYAVYERLGQGGMATVHRAEKRGVGIRRPIALKRLLPHVAIDPALVKLFVDEARLAAHLRHTNVAQTYELGKVGDTFFIAMEYASGPTLAQIMRQSLAATGDIPLPITVAILQQVCDALDYAHNLCDESGQSLRIIHRDVSPANIIVTNTGIVKLIDFGIAKATISSVKTQTGFIKGKFGYIAPEYISGKIDARVDLFAIGVVAHEMMTGRRLFEGKDDFETLQNIREMNPQPPSRWNRNVPPDLDDIVMTALQRDPADRWQSAGAMQVALANVARSFGRVVGNQQLAMWVDWAFSQRPGTDRAADSAHDTAAFQSDGTDPEGSLSMEAVAADSVSSLRQPPDHGLPVHAAPDPDSSLSIEISGVPEVGETTLDGAEPTPQPATPVELTPQPATPVELTPQPEPALRPEPVLRPEPAPRPEPVLRPEPAPRPEPVPQPGSVPRTTSRNEPSPRPELAARRELSPRPELAARRQPLPRPELAARRPSPQRPRGPSDSDETLPVERLTLTTGDIELLTPQPEIAPPPAMLQPPPPAPASPMPPAMPLARSSRTHDAVPPPVPPPVAPPTAPAVAARPPSLAHPRPSRSIAAVVPPQPPTVRASRTVDAVSPPPTMRPSRTVDAVSPPGVRPSRTVDAVSPPPTLRPSRTVDAVSPPPTMRPSRPFDAVLPPPTPPPQRRSRPMLPFAAPPTPPRASQIGDAVEPPLVPSPDGLDTLGTPPQVAASQELEVLARPPPRVPPSAPQPSAPPPAPPQPDGIPPAASSFELPVASSFELPAAPADDPAEQAAPPAPAAEVKRATRSRHKATQRSRPQPDAEPAPAAMHAAPAATRRAPRATHTAGTATRDTAPASRRRHDLLWLTLLMIVLGAGATAAAYYWPDLW